MQNTSSNKIIDDFFNLDLTDEQYTDYCRCVHNFAVHLDIIEQVPNDCVDVFFDPSYIAGKGNWRIKDYDKSQDAAHALLEDFEIMLMQVYVKHFS